jgi:hypothetical protein
MLNINIPDYPKEYNDIDYTPLQQSLNSLARCLVIRTELTCIATCMYKNQLWISSNIKESGIKYTI